MTHEMRGVCQSVAAVGLLFLASQSPGLAQKGRKIPVGDDPSIKEGSPTVVLVEVSDFQ